MRDELVGLIMTVFVCPDDDWERVLEQVDRQSPYAPTDAIFAYVVAEADAALRHTSHQYTSDRSDVY